MNVLARKRYAPHSPLVLGAALLFGLVEMVALSRARLLRKR